MREELKKEPYEYCSECEENYYTTDGRGSCKVADKYQRLPRDKYRGALGQCIKIGGAGC